MTRRFCRGSRNNRCRSVPFPWMIGLSSFSDAQRTERQLNNMYKVTLFIVIMPEALCLIM